MYFGVSSETDYTVNQGQWHRIFVELEDYMRENIAQSELSQTGWKFYYVPILMSYPLSLSYPARTRCLLKKKIMNCSPQLDYERYVEGDAAVREAIVYEGLLIDGLVLFDRAGFSDDQKSQFENIVRRKLKSLLV